MKKVDGLIVVEDPEAPILISSSRISYEKVLPKAPNFYFALRLNLLETDELEGMLFVYLRTGKYDFDEAFHVAFDQCFPWELIPENVVIPLRKTGPYDVYGFGEIILPAMAKTLAGLATLAIVYDSEDWTVRFTLCLPGRNFETRIEFDKVAEFFEIQED